MTSQAPEGLPSFVVAIDGRELDREAAEDVLKIEVVEEVGRLALATVLLRNWDPEANTMDESDEGAPGPGSLITISLGYQDQLEVVFDGLVVAMSARGRTGSLPELELRCRCRGILLLGAQRFRVWSDQSDYDAVASLCRDVGLETDGKSAFQSPFVVQYRLSDWAFIQARASALGIQAYVRGTTLHFAAARVESQTRVTLEWGQGLIDFDLSQDLSTATGDAQASSWDPESKEVISVKAAASAARYPKGERPALTQLLSKAKLTGSRAQGVGQCIPMDQAELGALSQSLVDRGATDACFGTLTTYGNSAIRADSTLEVRGLGAAFDGPYYVTRVRQRFDVSGFETQIGLGTPPTPRPHGHGSDERVMPAMDSLVLATVESFEDADRSQARVQIRLPWMDESAAPLWARLATSAGGAGRGILFVPEPGDEVMVQFVDGDPRHPVVVGGLWNGKDAPPEPYDAEKNDRRAIVSRAGHRVVFHDGDEQPGISLETAAGQVVRLDDTSGSESISLDDKSGNRLAMNSDGISITAASGTTLSLSAPGGDIAIGGKALTADTDADMVMKAGGGATLEGMGQVTVKGATATIDGGSLLTATGGMIKLN